MQPAAAVSTALGVIYTAAWSISFYPQAVLNWRRKSVEGLSIDFATLNPVGFACYTAYNTGLLASSAVRREYAGRHDGHLPQVAWNDVLFSSHAFVVSSFTLFQTFIYKRSEKQRLSAFNAVLLTTLVAITLSLVVVTATARLGGWLDLMYFFSFVKLYISFAKYLPQAWLNYQRKSTVGWSIENILLDFTGGVLSLAQLVLDSAVSHDWSGITGNVGKLGLSLLSIAFDIVFMLQHFVLYRHSSQPSVLSSSAAAHSHEERRPLLGSA